MTFEEKLGYFFFDKHILRRALTRQAFALEQTEPCEDQEAYLILGQAVLHTVLTELLIRSGYNDAQAIWDHAIALQQEEKLAIIGREIGIGFVIKLSTNEKQQQAYDNPAVLADTLKAAIGGIYFDGGFSAARAIIRRLFNEAFPNG